MGISLPMPSAAYTIRGFENWKMKIENWKFEVDIFSHFKFLIFIFLEYICKDFLHKNTTNKTTDKQQFTSFLCTKLMNIRF